MQRAVYLLCSVIMGLLSALPVWADHDVPYYPSFYPQEIRLDTVDPTAAALLLHDKKMHAYIGATPHFAATVPDHLAFMESLRSYRVMTFNPASAIFQERQDRCVVARHLLAIFAREPQDFVFHPYPITPYHADYLQHADRLVAAKALVETAGLRAPETSPLTLKWRVYGPWAERLVHAPWRVDDQHWDVTAEDVPLDNLVAATGAGWSGWPAPPWVKEGWFQAYQLLAPTLSDPERQAATVAFYRRLERGEYGSVEERLHLERQLVSLLTVGCERVVVGYTVRQEFYNNDFSSGVENIAYDAQLGFNAPVFIRTVKLKDFLWNGWLRLGTDAAPTAAWNPLAGFSDTAGRLIWAALGEPALFPVPYNASWIPNRVNTAPAVEQHHSEEIVVPHDTVLPQPGTGKLSPVAAGRRSTARVTYQILASAFYDGTQMDMADLLYPYVVAYRWGVKSDTEQRFYDPAVATATALMRERLVGVRLVRINQTMQKFGDTEVLRESPVVDVYLNHTAMDDRQVAALAPPWSSVPWHVLVLMEEAVQRNLAAFSESEALRRGVPWLDLVRDAHLHKQLQALVEVFEQQGYRPEALQDMVTPEIARQRWARLKEFAHTQGHFLVTNGPYRLQTWSQAAVVLQVIRDLTYPVGLATFNRYAAPPRAVIKQVTVDAGHLTIAADVEKVETAMRLSHVVQEPLKPGVRQGVVPIHPGSRYMVIGPDGAVLRAGTATWEADGHFTVDLTAGALPPGRHTILVALYPNDNAIDPEVQIVPYDITP
jgi:hypothetical protein